MPNDDSEFEIDYLGERYRPLIIIGWDTFQKKPCVSMETHDWDALNWREEQEIFAAIANLAIDFAPLIEPETFVDTEE